MRNRSVGVSPISTIRPTSAAVFYRLHERSGTSFADALANGPAMTLSGTGTPLANPGYITPNGTDNWLSANSELLRSIGDLRNLNGKTIVAAFDWWHDGDLTGNETFICYGNVGSNVYGGWELMTNASEQLAIVIRGKGASTQTSSVFPSSGMAARSNRRVPVLVEVFGTSDTTVDVNAFVDGLPFSSLSGLSLTGNGATSPCYELQDGLTIGARNNTVGAKTQLANSAASNMRYGRFFMGRFDYVDHVLFSDAAQEFNDYFGEIPVCLGGR